MKRKKKKSEASRERLERVAIQAAKKGAEVIRRHYEKRLRISFKGDVNLVTQADLISQETITKIIRKAFPDHAILAEERNMGHDQSLVGPIWVIDPLDGTTNFAHGFPMFGISIAFRGENETQFGLVYNPLLKELFLAHRGKGAFLNGKRIHVSQTPTLSVSLLSTGFPYDRRTSKDNNLDYFCHFELAAQCVRRAGAATLDLAHVACGRFDGFWEPKLAAWDIAAGVLLVTEAGGKVTDYKGNAVTDLWGGQLVATNGKIHAEMISGIAKTQEQRVV